MSHVETAPAPNHADTEPFTGGRTAMVAGAVAGVVGLALTALGAVTSPKLAGLSYLVAFTYWTFIALGALALLMANHAAGARWNVTVRRLNESIAGTIPIFALLFLPVLFGARQIFSWVAPGADASKETLKLLAHKHAYLNLGSFTTRAIIYFAIWIALAGLLRGWSVRQDESGAAELTLRARKLASGGLPFLVFSGTFAAFDWLMSLNPLWSSTIFGLYILAGGFVASIALLCIVAGRMPFVTPAQLHNLGKYLLAFVAFWAYMAFSQYMLIWVGNLPEEVPWILLRRAGLWRWIGVFLIVGHFVLPFLVLLSRDLKRKPGPLAVVAAWVLFVHYVDVFWIVMPTAGAEGLALHWTQLTSFVGVGGVALAFGLWRLRGVRPVPVRDPYLEDSLRYVQP